MKPYLLLDIDGVLNVLARPKRAPKDAIEFVVQAGNTGFDILTLARYGDWLDDLARSYELVWATTWEDLANEEMGPRLGLPELPVVHFERSLKMKTWKLPDVDKFVGNRPAAWIDDDLHGDAFSWAHKRNERGVPTLLVHAARWRFEHDHYHRLLKFAQKLQRPADESTLEGET